MTDEPFRFGYTNYKGEFAIREAVPIRVWFGATEWHPEPQWLLTAFDTEKQANRDFALSALASPAKVGELEELRRECKARYAEVGIWTKAASRFEARARWMEEALREALPHLDENARYLRDMQANAGMVTNAFMVADKARSALSDSSASAIEGLYDDSDLVMAALQRLAADGGATDEQRRTAVMAAKEIQRLRSPASAPEWRRKLPMPPHDGRQSYEGRFQSERPDGEGWERVERKDHP